VLALVTALLLTRWQRRNTTKSSQAEISPFDLPFIQEQSNQLNGNRQTFQNDHDPQLHRIVLGLEHPASEEASKVRELATQEVNMRFGDLPPGDFRQVAIEEIVASVTARMGIVSDDISDGPPAYATNASE
jgi:hypothetical protein